MDVKPGDVIAAWNQYLDKVDPYTAAAKLADMGMAAFERAMALKESDPGTAYAILAEWRAMAQGWYARKGYGGSADETHAEVLRLDRVFREVLALWDLLVKRGAHLKSVTAAVFSGLWSGFLDGLHNVASVFAAPFTPKSGFWGGAAVIVALVLVAYVVTRKRAA